MDQQTLEQLKKDKELLEVEIRNGVNYFLDIYGKSVSVSEIDLKSIFADGVQVVASAQVRVELNP